MNIAGIIVEYNPMHKGHIYHINECKKLTNCDGIVAVMSGNFTQRGTPSIIDKWLKTKLALQNGVDLVLELPTIYSLSSAEFFAFGSISLLNRLNIVNSICFGSEYDNIDDLLYIANILSNEPLEYKQFLKTNLNLGLSYASSRNNALNSYIKNSNFDLNDIFSKSNNILGIEYCKNILKLKSKIKPMSIKRLGNEYNDLNLNLNFSSASSIRNHLNLGGSIYELKDYVPVSTYNLLKELYETNYNFVYDNSMFKFIKYKLLSNPEAIKNIPDASEGLYNKILREILKSKCINELILNCKSKRYTYTRINRILTQLFIGFDLFDTEYLRKQECPYARILGFNYTGQKILREIKNNCDFPLYTKLPKNQIDTLKLDIQATNTYSLINKNINPFSDFLKNPIIENTIK